MEKFPLQRLGDVLTRVDELLVMLLKVEEEQLKLLQAIAAVRAPPPVSVTEIARELRVSETTVREIVERVVAVPAAVTEVALSTESIRELALELATRLVQLPNMVKMVEFDTSITDWKSLRAEKKIKPRILLGFWVEAIGGGFEYQIVREGTESDPKTAEVDDKWELEFDDLLVKGAGVGKAHIWYWWRE